MKGWLVNNGAFYGMVVGAGGFCAGVIGLALARTSVISSSILMTIVDIAIGCGVFCVVMIGLSTLLNYWTKEQKV